MLSPPDVQKILAGEKIIGSTRRNMGHVAVIVEESKSKKFDATPSIGDHSYVEKLGAQVPTVTEKDATLTIKISRLLMAANQSQAEHIFNKDVKKTESSTFDSSITVQLPDLDGMYINAVDNMDKS